MLPRMPWMVSLVTSEHSYAFQGVSNKLFPHPKSPPSLFDLFGATANVLGWQLLVNANFDMLLLFQFSSWFSAAACSEKLSRGSQVTRQQEVATYFCEN